MPSCTGEVVSFGKLVLYFKSTRDSSTYSWCYLIPSISLEKSSTYKPSSLTIRALRSDWEIFTSITCNTTSSTIVSSPVSELVSVWVSTISLKYIVLDCPKFCYTQSWIFLSTLIFYKDLLMFEIDWFI